MTLELHVAELEDTIDQMQEIIASMEMDIELMKLEIVSRGDRINQLSSQNRLLKRQLMENISNDPKVPVLLKPKEEDGKVC